MHAVTSRIDLFAPEAEEPKGNPHFRLPAVDRAINLFELLANSQNGLTLSELSRKLNVPKSTTHYLIHTLATRGYVQCATKGRYSLGLCLAKLASASTAELTLRRVVTPHLSKIVAKVNLTAALTVLHGAESVVIATVSSAQGKGGGAWIGRHIDVHCNAQGKALIAFLPEAELNKIFVGREFAPFTSKTIRSLPALKAHLIEVRNLGYAVSDGEYFQGFRGVAAPVFDSLHTVIAAISVRGSTKDISTSRIPELGRELVRTSQDITLHLCG